MNEYELDGDSLVLREPAELAENGAGESKPQTCKPRSNTGALGIEQMLSAARARLRRLSPTEAYEAASKAGTILVDIRPEGQRATEGGMPGALIIERNMLEWRLDPASSSRLPIANAYNLQVIVFCSEGYASSLAAAALQDLGLWRATDMIGGFQAWSVAGLPSVPPSKALKIAPAGHSVPHAVS